MEHKLCVLIDFENVAAGTEKEGLGRFDIKAVMHRLMDKGRINVARAYGDWGRFARFKQRMLELGITMAELTSYKGAEKNRADIALVVDAMEMAFTRPWLDTFVLMSGDSDFTPLVMKLKELDKRVIGIGTRGSTSRLLVECCDEFLFYESIQRSPGKELFAERAPAEDWRDRHAPAERRPSRAPAPVEAPEAAYLADEAPPETEETAAATLLSQDAAMALLVDTVAGIQKDEPGPMLAGGVKQSMQRKAPAFDETEYGFTNFARFLEAARDRGFVTLARDQRAGGYRVDLPGASSAAEDDGGGRGASGGAAHDERRPASDAPEGGLAADEDDGAIDEARLDGAAGALQKVLMDRGFHPATHFLRHTVVHELVDHVTERQQKKKRNTLMYVPGDIARRCRRTEPVVHPRLVKSILSALKAAGEFQHPKGGPVRGNNAHFTLVKDAEELLASLRRFYLQQLVAAGASFSDAEALSQLLWGDADHALQAAEDAAWAQHHAARGAAEPAGYDGGGDDGDAGSDAEDAPPVAAPVAEAAPAPAAVVEASPPAAAPEAAPVAEAAPAAEEPPRRAPRRRRTGTKSSGDAKPDGTPDAE